MHSVYRNSFWAQQGRDGPGVGLPVLCPKWFPRGSRTKLGHTGLQTTGRSHVTVLEAGSPKSGHAPSGGPRGRALSPDLAPWTPSTHGHVASSLGLPSIHTQPPLLLSPLLLLVGPLSLDLEPVRAVQSQVLGVWGGHIFWGPSHSSFMVGGGEHSKAVRREEALLVAHFPEPHLVFQREIVHSHGEPSSHSPPHLMNANSLSSR